MRRVFGGHGVGGLEEAGAAAVEGIGHEQEVEEDDCGEAQEEEEEGHHNHHYHAFQKEEEELPLAAAQILRRRTTAVFLGESWHVGKKNLGIRER